MLRAWSHAEPIKLRYGRNGSRVDLLRKTYRVTCFEAPSSPSQGSLSNCPTNRSQFHSVSVKSSGLRYSEDLFKYTRGRFVCNEEHELSQRQVRFDVHALARCAAEAVGAKSCVSIGKYPDGMYNKAMLLTMDDGSQVVAKVPNPNAGLPHFTTASEVATMDFARTVLRTPVPKVLASSSMADHNSVGAEYIIMEKSPGIELERVWPNMDITERFEVVRAIAGFQKSWTSVCFNKFGSLYYANDLHDSATTHLVYIDKDGKEVLDDRYAVGPSTGREFIDNGRATVSFDRGPWSSLEEYHKAIGNREITSVNELLQLPKSPITLCGPGTYIPSRERKLRALACYLKLIRYLLPTDPALQTAHLWHDDLHVANIFVNPSNPTEVVGIIDWQSTELAPLYFQARQPQIIDYDGAPVPTLERPQLPDDFSQLKPDEKARVKTLYFQQSLCVAYNTLTHKKNPKLWSVFEFQQSTSYLLLLLARNLVIDGEASYLLQVAELESSWDTLPGAQDTPYPLKFSASDRQEFEAQHEGAVLGMQAMSSIKVGIGELFPVQGIVRPDKYEEALDALDQMRDQVIETFAKNEQERETWLKMWPFGQS